MSVMVETYRDSQATLLEPSPDFEERKALAEGLGLEVQAPFVEPRADDVALVFEELQGEALEVWQDFLPNSYSSRDGEWSEYDYDFMPTTALDEIRVARDMGVFHDIEIWTPDDDPDPMAVGVIYATPAENSEETRYFAIARWGESLMPFEKIRELVLARQAETQELEDDEYMSWGLCLFIIVCGLCALAVLGYMAMYLLNNLYVG